MDASLQGVARPGTTVRELTTTVSASSTMCVEPRPRTSGPESQMDARATAGTVRPMLAMAEPRARFRLVCTRSRRAERRAAMVSGSSTSRAMITPTTAWCSPASSTPDSMVGDTPLASPTTPLSARPSSPRLVQAVRADGASAWLSAVITSP